MLAMRVEVVRKKIVYIRGWDDSKREFESKESVGRDGERVSLMK